MQMESLLSGKFRRYHHLSLIQHLLIPSIVLLNIRDLFLVIAGFFQAFTRLLLWRPDVVFTKGGFVCLPVGWAAWLLRIPLVIHDSDVYPGLTNRMLAKKATAIATGAPLENYPYPMEKSHYVGIPIDASFRVLSDKERAAVKKELGCDPDRPLVSVIGGGLGSKVLNDATVRSSNQILTSASLLLISGKQQYSQLVSQVPQDSAFVLKEFVSNGVADILGASDIVVSRAGATALLELAALRKPTILVPSSRLTWQVKHAATYAAAGAVVCLDETRFDDEADTSYVDAILTLLASPKRRNELGASIAKLATPHAASDMADIIYSVARK